MRAYWVAFVLYALIAPPAAAQKEDLAATWVARNCEAVYDQIFKETPPAQVELGQISISVVLGGEWVRDTAIRLLLLEKEVKGVVIQSEGKPLCDQLLELRRQQPALDVGTAVRQVKILRRQIDSQSSPELLRHAKRLLGEDVSLRLDDTIYFPGRSIQIRVSGFKEEISVSFSIPEPSADKSARWGSGRTSQPDLRDWVEKLLAILRLQV